jgi:hypothetical protein
MSTKPFVYSLLAYLLFIPLTAGADQARSVVVGVNVVGVQQMNESQQDALIEQLVQNHVKTVRTGIGEKFNRFIIRAYERGIGAVVIVYPGEGNPDARKRPADPSVGLNYAQSGLTDADPAKFKTLFATQLAPLEEAGVHLTALELGNEINGPFFNGDFLPAQASGRVLGIEDLNNPHDPEGRAITASYLGYLKVVAALKELRDHSKLNQATPIISAGLADGGLPGKKPGQRLDGVSVPATLEFLRQHGMDNLVDGYGVHVYPTSEARGGVLALVDYLNKDAFAVCTSAKPCWLTEWGFSNSDESCPINDQGRVQQVGTMRGALKHFAEQGRLAASIVFSWSTGHKGIVRCGAVTDAGNLALSAI